MSFKYTWVCIKDYKGDFNDVELKKGSFYRIVETSPPRTPSKANRFASNQRIYVIKGQVIDEEDGEVDDYTVMQVPSPVKDFINEYFMSKTAYRKHIIDELFKEDIDEENKEG